MTVAAHREELKTWDIGENDFGGMMIFHRHAAQAVPAYVIDEVADWRIAECSGCMETLEINIADLHIG
jgi:hypothetical protein